MRRAENIQSVKEDRGKDIAELWMQLLVENGLETLDIHMLKGRSNVS